LPGVEVASHDEVLLFVESHQLEGRGIGWVDAHLLASAALARIPLWTRDRRLREAAVRLRSACTPS
jgi:predicted nucleic acid-binding protein